MQALPLSSRPLRASLSSRSTIIFTVVAVVVLGSTIATTGIGRGPRGRLGEARARMNAECTRMSHAPDPRSATRTLGNPCDLAAAPPRVLPELKLGKQELEAADLALRSSDRAGAAALLASVLERADGVDRSHTFLASLVAGQLIDGVSSRVDGDAALLEDSRLAAAIRRTSYASARHPLESERLHGLAVLANIPAQAPLRSAGLVEGAAVQAMTEVESSVRERQAAVLVKDVHGCENAAERTTGLAAQVTGGGGICRHAVRIVESGERLDRLRARVIARAPRLRMTTARRL